MVERGAVGAAPFLERSVTVTVENILNNFNFNFKTGSPNWNLKHWGILIPQDSGLDKSPDLKIPDPDLGSAQNFEFTSLGKTSK